MICLDIKYGESIMAISIKSKKMTLIVSKSKIFQIFNSIIILFAYYCPWLGDLDWSKKVWYEKTGFEAMQFFKNNTMFSLSLEETLSGRISMAFRAFPLFVGSYTMLIYCVFNIFETFFKSNFEDMLFLRILKISLLVLGVISLISILDMVGIQHISYIHWGYWVALVGLGSSFVLELSYFLRNEHNDN
jgi:hypothetical protein